MGNVGREVNTEADGDDEGVAWDDVNSEAPEVHEPSHLKDRGGHTEDDNTGSSEAAKEDEDSEEDCEEGSDHVLVELSTNDLICLPVGVPEYKIRPTISNANIFLMTISHNIYMIRSK